MLLHKVKKFIIVSSVFSINYHHHFILQAVSKRMPTYQSCACRASKAAAACKRPRRFIVGGNWKMNGDKKLISEILTFLKKGQLDKDVEIVLGVPFVYLERVKMSCLPEGAELAAQNCYKVAKGAFTGEVSPLMLKDLGITWVILGHSERRQLFCETDELIAEKCKYALEVGLKVILCVGETLEQKEKNRTMDVVERQVKAVANEIKCEDWAKVVIAYEPIWAIGTGKTATPEQAQQIHMCLRQYICAYIGAQVGQKIRIQYGGSVTAANCKELAGQPDIDGFLVGGASLKPEFIEIVNSGAIKNK